MRRNDILNFILELKFRTKEVAQRSQIMCEVIPPRSHTFKNGFSCLSVLFGSTSNHGNMYLRLYVHKFVNANIKKTWTQMDKWQTKVIFSVNKSIQTHHTMSQSQPIVRFWSSGCSFVVRCVGSGMCRLTNQRLGYSGGRPLNWQELKQSVSDSENTVLQHWTEKMYMILEH